MTDSSTPFELLKEEMEQDEIYIRVNAIHRIKIVATLMGHDFVKSTLLPFIENLIKKEEDEVLFAIAEQIEYLSQFLQGNQTILLPFLEQLASQEETVVRDMAVKSLINISQQLGEYEIQNFYVPLILRLASNDSNFTCRVSAVNLMCSIYTRSGQHKEKIRNKFIELCGEETPMVRRAIAQKIGELATVIEKEYVLSALIQSVKQLISDEQDLVRVLVLNSLKQIAKILKKEENKQHILPIIIAATEDKSWRVRLALSKLFSEIAEAFGEEGDNVSLIQIFTNLLRDAENDVRIASIQSLTKFVKILSPEKLGIIVPHLQYLAKDFVPQVRSGVTEVVSLIVQILPKEVISSKLLSYIIDLFDDESKEVRQGANKAASKFAECLGPDSLKTLLPLFKKSIEDPKWRVRVEAYEALSNIAKAYHNNEVFMNNLEPLFMSFLKDKISIVRESAANKLPQIIIIYKEWAIGKLYKQLIDCLNKDNSYLLRQTGLYCLKILTLNVSSDFVSEKILPFFYKNLNDTVPNIRFIQVKILKEILGKIDNQNIQNEIKQQVSNLVNDSDRDVKYFAQELLKQL
ncbi:protein phosphatase 2 regulatory subunit A, alpha isoform, putative [Ichthyophthirius multifiliis]|uniref:Protein phosphatase 2 regulatory subunit A, alpha isoform, putative n=1 Tax=Ichthyophthirius multifiliis TaxID=5932 RepID=G0QJP8_ICHMU|nr:protein phosphatase 2 regulatory subunit A, alpha isoform, putative [Ichthyophthirius multifiliis]EGR34557.1 protein phosphatase 2 regulatory subunit A, alpha isoform, putative [Ichthyophthirius multifiliis]|eukprot:XP_004039861.1 protein phosphatase 2 regulatory subunit A, alpha isoform, putative [Ichthyophthirius multifiliis]